MKRVSLWMLVSIIACLLGASELGAQTASTSAITGTITDASSGLVPGATITALNSETGQSRTGTTGADGTFNFGLMPPGSYKLTISANGFKQDEVSLSVAVTEVATINRRLTVGSQAETVNVSATAEGLQTESSSLGTVVSTRTVAALPLTTRNYTDILGLSAGANGSVPNATALGKGGVNLAVNGASQTQNAFQMDGVSIVPFGGSGSNTENPFFPTYGIPNPDSLQEFKIQTSLFDAGYGRNPGANVNVVTKSGTNQLHGSAFEFFRNTKLNATDYFANLSGLSRPVLNQNQYGATLGGPIKKDKLFIFGSYQRTWQKNGAASQGFSSGVTLPPIPSGDRNSAGFRSALGAAMCPDNKDASVRSRYVTNPGNLGAGAGTQVACDGSNINPVALKILQARNADGSFFIPGSPDGTFLLTAFSRPAYDSEHQGLLNLDYVVNSKHTLGTRYFRSIQTQDLQFPGPAMAPGVVHSADVGYHTGVIKFTSVLSATTVNEFHAAIQRTTNSTFANLTRDIDNAVVGMSPLGNTNSSIPSLAFTGLFTAGLNSQYNTQLHNTNYQLGDQFSWTKQKHNIRFGGEVEHGFWNQTNAGQTNGNINFQTFSDFLIGLPGGCGAAVAGVCNGATASNVTSTTGATRTAGFSGVVHEPRIYNSYLFFQDDYKIRRNLTINAGVRWEYDGITLEKLGTATNVIDSLMKGVPIGTTPATQSYNGFIVPGNYPIKEYGALLPGIAQSNSSQIPLGKGVGVPKTNFAPRLGISWQIDDKTVLRGGGGLFYDRIYGQFLQRSYFNAPPVAILMDTPASSNQAASLSNPWRNTPPGTWPGRWIDFTNNLGSGLSTNRLDEVYHTPVTYSWNLTLQRQLPGKVVMELAYVGSKGIHQSEISHFLNGARLASPENPIVGQTIVNGATVNNVITTNTTGNARLRVPFLGFNAGGLLTSAEDLDYRFNSFQATVRRQFSSGITFQGAYTWSRAFTNSSAAGSGANSNDPTNLRQQWGLNTQYRPQRLVLTYDYRIPTGSLKGWAKTAAGGWGLSGVTTIQGGSPFTIVDTRGGAIYGLTTSRAQLASGLTYADIASSGDLKQRLGGNTGGPGYFNNSAFTTVPVVGGNGTAGTGGTGWGNMGIAPILGPGQFNFDASLAKITRIGEKSQIQFRTEFFNVFNHAQFNGPGANVAVASTFGRITSTAVNPRLIQLALKFVF